MKKTTKKTLYLLTTTLLVGGASLWWAYMTQASSVNFIEDFSTTTYRDPVSTTADWNTTDSEVRLSYGSSSWFTIDKESEGMTNVSGNSGNSYVAQMLLDENEYPIIVWYDTTGSNRSDIFISRWNPTADSGNGGFVKMDNATLGAENVSNTAQFSSNPSVVLDGNNYPVIAWEDYTANGYGEILLSRWDGTQWVRADGTTPGYENISNTAKDSWYPVLTLDENGYPIVAWEEYTDGNAEVYLTRWDGTAWVAADLSTPGAENVSNNSGDSKSPIIIKDENNRPILSWYDDSSGQTDVLLTRWDGTQWVRADGTTSGADNVSNTAGVSASPQMILDSGNKPILVWYDNTTGVREIYLSRWNGTEWAKTDGTTSGYENISNTAGESYQPTLTLDENGAPIVLWYDNTPGNYDILVSRYAGGSWKKLDESTTGYDNVSNTATEASYRPQVVFQGTERRPFATWWEYGTTNYDIRFGRWGYDPSATSQIAQSLKRNGTNEGIKKATLTVTESKPTDTTITYEITNDGGSNWYTVTPGVEYTFPSYGDDLRWRATLGSTGSDTPHLTELQIDYKIAPTVSTFTPADDGTGFATVNDLTLEFNEIVNKGTGNITLKKYIDDSTVETIDVTSGQVTGEGTATITVNPSADLEDLTQYYVLIDVGTFTNADGQEYLGLTGKDTWNFTSANNLPIIDTLSPVDDGNEVSKTPTLQIVFSEVVNKGTGNILIKKTSDLSTAESIDVTGGTVTGGGTNTISIATSVTLEDLENYHVIIPGTAFYDEQSVPGYFGGIADPTTWNFTTLNVLPTLTGTFPTDGEKTIDHNTTLTLTFHEAVTPNTGNLTIKKLSDDSIVEAIDVTTGQVTGGGTTTITVNPSVELADETDYYVQIDATAFQDIQFTPGLYAGIIDNTTWNFATVNHVPVVSLLSPLDNASSAQPSASLQLTFPENVYMGTGNIVIRKSEDDSILETIDVTGGRVTGDGTNTITIDPVNSLLDRVEHYVEIPASAFVDADAATFNFVDPRDIAGLSLWLDAADDGSITHATNSVSQWRDKSGNLHHATQSSSSDQPTYSDASNTITFASDYLDLPTPAELGIQNSDFEMFVVSKTTSTDTQYLVGGAVDNYELALHTGGGIDLRLRSNGADSNAEFDNATALNDGSFHILNGRVDAENTYVRLDGTVGASTGTTGRSSDNTALVLGKKSDDSRYFAGEIAEVIIFDKALSTSERANVELYLAHKYGLISALPTDHDERYPWSFTTENLPPATNSLSPADNSTQIAIDTNLEITFNEPIAKGTGSIKVIPTVTSGLVGHWPLMEGNETQVGSSVVTNGDNELALATLVVDSTTGVGGTLARTTERSQSGDASGKFTGDGVTTGSNTAYVVAEDGGGFTALSPGKKYKYTFDLYLPDSQTTTQLTYGYNFNSGAVPVGTVTTTNSWVQVSGNFPADEGGQAVLYVSGNNTDANTDVFYIDNVVIKELQTSDASINSNNGTIKGASLTTDWNEHTNAAALFDGVNDSIEIGNTGLSNIQTISFWVKPSENSTALIDFDGGTTTLSIQDGKITPSGFVTNVLNEGKITKNVGVNIWNHITLVGVTIPVSDLTLGRVGSEYFGGRLADVRLYNRVLSNEEISLLASRTPTATVDINSASVSIGGAQSNVATITLPASLDYLSDYAVQVPIGVFKDSQSMNFPGINDIITWNFTTIDTAPSPSLLSPTNGSTEVPPRITVQDTEMTTLVIQFDEVVTKNAGNIVLRKVADSSVTYSIDVTSAAVALDGTGDTATVTLPGNLGYNTTYSVEIPSTAFKDVDNSTTQSYIQANPWIFTTRANVPPQISSYFPTHEAVNQNVDTQLKLIFDERTTASSSKYITISKFSDDSVVEQIDVTDSSKASWDTTTRNEETVSVLTITPENTLAYDTKYTISIDPRAVQDVPSAGIIEYLMPESINQAWVFTTRPDSNAFLFTEDFHSTTYRDATASTPNSDWNTGSELARLSSGTTGTVASDKVNGTAQYIRTATLTSTETTPENTTIAYQLSNDGGTTWNDVTLGEELTFPESASDLRWRATLTRDAEETDTPTISLVTINYSNGFLATGTVTQTVTGAPVANATVKFIDENGLEFTTSTDTDGYYSILLPWGHSYTKRVWTSDLVLQETEVSVSVNDVSETIEMEAIVGNLVQTEYGTHSVSYSSGKAADNISGMARGESLGTQVAQDGTLITGNITKETFLAAYKASQEEINRLNQGIAGKILTATNDQGEEVFLGYQAGRLSTESYERQPQKLKIRDIVRASQRELVNQTYLSSAESNPLTPQFTTHDFVDVGIRQDYNRELMKMNTLGLITPDKSHRIYPNAPLEWEDLLENVTRGTHTEPVSFQLMLDKWYDRVPDISVPPTRGRAIKLLADAFELEINPEAVNSSFLDIDREHPLAALLVAAKTQGWLNSWKGYVFEPDKVITRAEFAALFIPAYEVKEKNKPSDLAQRLEFIQKFAREDETEEETRARLGVRQLQTESDVAAVLRNRAREEAETEKLIQSWPARPGWRPHNPNTVRSPLETRKDATVRRQDKPNILRNPDIQTTPEVIQQLKPQSKAGDTSN